jgi:hypothetical protein
MAEGEGDDDDDDERRDKRRRMNKRETNNTESRKNSKGIHQNLAQMKPERQIIPQVTQTEDIPQMLSCIPFSSCIVS